MGRFSTFGNELHSGRRSIDFVGRRRLWYAVAAVLMLLSLLSLATRQLNAGIQFRGGSEFRVSDVADPSTRVAQDALGSVLPTGQAPLVSIVGGDDVRVQTNRLDLQQVDQVKAALATAYKVPQTNITSDFVGPSWGKDVSNKAITSLIVFLVLVSLVITLYFRTWKMALAAIVALVHDLLLTLGVYALVGFEVTPESVIGFLTILGYSLYDTVVVFDKVRENTEHVTASTKRTYAEAANLAVNQTLVRSINTSVVALLPIGAILFIGAFLLGAGTLKDISLALFVGIAAGTYSSIFLATPLLSQLRMREPEIKAHAERVLRRRREGQPAERELVGAGATAGATAAGATAVDAGPATPAAPVVTTSGEGGRELRQPSGGQRQQPRRGSSPAKGRPGGRRS
jgi:preprotein translocase subunit SecF